MVQFHAIRNVCQKHIDSSNYFQQCGSAAAMAFRFGTQVAVDLRRLLPESRKTRKVPKFCRLDTERRPQNQELLFWPFYTLKQIWVLQRFANSLCSWHPFSPGLWLNCCRILQGGWRSIFCTFSGNSVEWFFSLKSVYRLDERLGGPLKPSSLDRVLTFITDQHSKVLDLASDRDWTNSK